MNFLSVKRVPEPPVPTTAAEYHTLQGGRCGLVGRQFAVAHRPQPVTTIRANAHIECQFGSCVRRVPRNRALIRTVARNMRCGTDIRDRCGWRFGVDRLDGDEAARLWWIAGDVVGAEGMGRMR